MKLSTDNYKGVRDFYPEEYKVQEYIFNVWKSTLKSFGFEQYDSSVLEPSEVFRQKSGEEIVNEQTYTFKDKGDREVSLRPEMTPIVARMIAKKFREYSFPIKWFSIPNLFRYERPQKGRLREHWQLNADIFGLDNIWGDVEIIELAYTIMKNFGLTESQFVIKINDRKSIDEAMNNLNISEDQKYKLAKLIDKKDKIDNFEELAREIIGKDFVFKPKLSSSVKEIIETLEKKGIKNLKFEPYLVRGFDYYTGVVFEIYDTGKENNRAVFGGGRFDDLVSMFVNEKISAVGIGMGDVVIRDMLETYDLLPKFDPIANIYVCIIDENYALEATQISTNLRDSGIKVITDFSFKKIGDQIKKANKLKIPFVICIGENEIKTKKVILKNLLTGKEKKIKTDKIARFLKKYI
jgi:histidyl-tRNA synthetase